jgi:hypothetical protein
MDLARLLWARVSAAHMAIGAPVEPFDEFALGDWEFYHLGEDGVLGIKLCPDLDGDALVVALPSSHSRLGSARTVRIFRKHLATGRKLYTLAWKEHYLAININQHMGGVALGLDGDGFIHFEYTLDSLNAATRAERGRERDAPATVTFGEEYDRGKKEHAEGT